jgi:hypothetical protein
VSRPGGQAAARKGPFVRSLRGAFPLLADLARIVK